MSPAAAAPGGEGKRPSPEVVAEALARWQAELTASAPAIGRILEEADREDAAAAPGGLTPAQREALTALCARYGVPFREEDYRPSSDLPAGYVAGWAGGSPGTIYVGCDADGAVSS